MSGPAVPSAPRRAAVLLVHGLVGWGFCGAIVGIGPRFFTMQTTLLLHALLAPLGFAALSLHYFRRFAYTTPLATAAVFVGLILALDAGVVAPFLEGSYEMFASVIGTWLPFALIFAATWASGHLVGRAGARRTPL